MRRINKKIIWKNFRKQNIAWSFGVEAKYKLGLLFDK
jgi:hypothetical protein